MSGEHLGLEEIRYVLLLPPAEVCVERVLERAGHGFTDLEATRQMHREFVDARAEAQHVLTSSAPSHEIAATIFDLVREGRLSWSVRR